MPESVKMIELTHAKTGAKVQVNAHRVGYCHKLKLGNEVITWLVIAGCGSIEVNETPEEIVKKMEHF